VRIPVLQIRRQEDRVVDLALGEHVLLEVVHRVLHELLDAPVRVFGPEALVGVEALDPALGQILAALDPVLRARVPEMQVGVDDEVLLAVLLVHALSLELEGAALRRAASPIVTLMGSERTAPSAKNP